MGDLIIRNCILRDSGNGLFIGAYDGETEDILVEGNWIYDNGIEGSIYEHNTYTAAIGITYQYNRFGPLRGTAGGNNLKDRSAGLVVRWNWLERGNRKPPRHAVVIGCDGPRPQLVDERLGDQSQLVQRCAD
jgi:hypothetical protein